MYAVVGCSACSALWMLEGRQETAECPRCGKTHQYGKLKTFVETEDADHAREVRASMLASREGHADEFAAVDSFAQLDERIGGPVVGDEEYLEGSGLDADDIAAAGETDNGGSKSRRRIVLDAVEAVEEPIRENVIEYASARGVPESFVERALEKLVRSGELTESGGRYRRL